MTGCDLVSVFNVPALDHVHSVERSSRLAATVIKLWLCLAGASSVQT